MIQKLEVGSRVEFLAGNFQPPNEWGMQYGVVFRPKAGQAVSGDAYLIMGIDDVCIVAVADGLGSGKEAAIASRQAMMTVSENVWADLPSILRQCHIALRGTRGAVMGVLKIEHERGQASYAGVGNIEFRSHSASSFRPINAYGIVGSRLPYVRAFEGAYAPGDMFVLCTDGIMRQFSLDKLPVAHTQSLQTLAEQIAAGFSRTEDDVTVLVVA